MRLTEDQMEKMLIDKGEDIEYLEDKNDPHSWIIDSTLVIECAVELGYTAKLDEKSQIYEFIK